MSDIFLTSDEHYGHRNILTHCERPFSDINEMREALIERHNKKVPNSPNYLTIHLGDMFWHTVEPLAAANILSRLNGRHALIYGNHDELIEKYEGLRSCFDWVRGSNKASGTQIIHWNKNQITLCHYAMTVWDRSHKGSWMLFGHSHGELETKGKSFDVGVDSHNFEPWSLEEVEQEMAGRPQGHVIPADKVWAGKEAPVCE